MNTVLLIDQDTDAYKPESDFYNKEEWVDFFMSKYPRVEVKGEMCIVAISKLEFVWYLHNEGFTQDEIVTKLMTMIFPESDDTDGHSLPWANSEPDKYSW